MCPSGMTRGAPVGVAASSQDGAVPSPSSAALSDGSAIFGTNDRRIYRRRRSRSRRTTDQVQNSSSTANGVMLSIS